MSHPINSIIKLTNRADIATDSDNVFAYNVESKETTKGLPRAGFFEKWGFGPELRCYVVQTETKAVKKGLTASWTDSFRNRKLNFKITYETKCLEGFEEKAIKKLQKGDSIGESFDLLLEKLIEKYYSDCTDAGIDPIESFERKIKSEKTLHQDFREYLENTIKEKTGLKTTIHLELDYPEILKIFRIAPLDNFELRLRDYDPLVQYNFEVDVEPSDKIKAILKGDKRHLLEKDIITAIQHGSLTDISIAEFSSKGQQIVEKFRNIVDQTLQNYGLQSIRYVHKPSDDGGPSVSEVPRYKHTVSVPIEGLGKMLQIENDIVLELSDRGLFISHNITDVKTWANQSLTDIIQKEVFFGKQYKEVLLNIWQNRGNDGFEQLIRDKLESVMEAIGYKIKLKSYIRTDFKFPEKSHPIFHKVVCQLDEYIIDINNTVTLTVNDEEKFIGAEIEDLEKWVKGKLDVIITNVVNYKSHQELVLEREEENIYGRKNKKTKTYEEIIREELEEEAMAIGCSVQHLLAQPHLPQLTWKEDFNIEFEEEFTTSEGGIPIKLRVLATMKIEKLSALPEKYFRPDADIKPPIEKLIRDTLKKELKLIPSVRAYVDLYEKSKSLIEEHPLDRELYNTLDIILQKEFSALMSYCNFEALPTPTIERYKELIKVEDQFTIEIRLLSQEDIPLLQVNYSILDIARWKVFNDKDYSVNETKEKITNKLTNILKDKLRLRSRGELNYFSSEDKNVINNFCQQEIAEQYGLKIKINEIYPVGGLQIDEDNKTIELNVKKIGELQRISDAKRLEDKFEKVEKLKEERKQYEQTVEHGFGPAKKEAKKKLKKIEAKIKKYENGVIAEKGGRTSSNQSSLEEAFQTNNNPKLKEGSHE